MDHSIPEPGNVVRDDLTTGTLKGGRGSDHLIHHRDPGVESHASTALSGFAGDDILEASVPDRGQLHMFASTGDDWFILDVTKLQDAGGHQGHHAYGGHGQNTFQFTNIAENHAPIVGRLDDFNPTSDNIMIEGTEIDLTELPQNIALPGGGNVHVRVIEVDHPEFSSEDLGPQHFLAIGDDIFYALEGARDLGNGTTGLVGEERHFIGRDALETLRSAETVQYENPHNFVPRDFYEHREDDLTLNTAPGGGENVADMGGKSAVHMYGEKGTAPNHGDHGSSGDHGGHGTRGEQVMRGKGGDDVIDGNSGNDTIHGGAGDDLISGGIDDDLIYGNSGDDMLWGGDGDDTLRGGPGDDFLHGGRGDDVLHGGDGNDTLIGSEGKDTFTGGGAPDSVNRFHFYEGSGQNIITDFKVGFDRITLQDDIDPLSVELYENENGNTVLNFGSKASVELAGVTLDAFREAAGGRVEEEDPIVTITTDPEDELLQELRIETGYYGDASTPSLSVEGVDYGVTAFDAPAAGGYTYVSGKDGTDGRGDEDHEDSDEEDEEDDDEDAGGDGSCFIATAAYRDPWHPDVKFLRSFRDEWLVHRGWGRVLVAVYWRVGPVLAGPVRRNPLLSRPVKGLIAGIVIMLRKVWKGVPGDQTYRQDPAGAGIHAKKHEPASCSDRSSPC